MNTPDSYNSPESSNVVPLIISIFGAVISFIPIDKLISLSAGIGAIIAAIFSMRNSYYSTKVSKKTLAKEEAEQEEEERLAKQKHDKELYDHNKRMDIY